MKRRALLQSAAMALFAGGRFGSASGQAAGQLDRYGGWKARTFEATGFFRVEKDDRWWIVTPEGNAFLSFGINHLYPDLFKQPYNSGAWQQRLGIETLNGPSFNAALRSWFLEVCQSYGFNTVGVHNALQILNTPRPSVPYMQPIRFVDIPHWKKEIPDENFVDVFSSEFAQHCDQMARQIAAPAKDDPFLLAYSMTDCPYSPKKTVENAQM